MPEITVTTIVKTVFEIPEGLSIEQIRRQGLSELSEMDEATDEVCLRQQKAIGRLYMGDAAPRVSSVEHSINEGAA